MKGDDDEYYRGVGVWLYDIAIGRYLRGLGATGDGMGPQGNGPGVSVLTPPGGIGPGGKGGVGGLPLLSASAKGFAASSWSWEVRRDKARWVSDERSLREAANAARGKDYSPNPYLINNSSFVIYFKPDYDMVINGRTYSGSGAYALPPYMSWHYPIDGVRIDNTATVRKVPNTVSVYFDGSTLRPSNLRSYLVNVGVDVLSWFGVGNGSGRMTRVQLDDGWGGLFDTRVFTTW
jgi:hypothetical protein